ncbi:FxsA protein [Gracilibacillus boraciitolerans JCM 21714]|uniref:FxsA protein n=1 Tax=Gracilibacillus boraciitolerans JCM 21714 TaxID=1298598 RepID=W4VIF0_9BACI|nr:FxsA family protein [Gracilibacillus boraciitolerans]GAE92987.1 FxsA protein [Gracilibacillus boraciitolerans JCM 21714]
MFRWLLLFILVVPALEIGLFVWAGGYIGPWWLIILIILTGIIGAWLAKQQGLETLNNARESMSRGVPPQEHIFDGICILIGGVVLLTPGFITDAVGFFLLIPITRRPFKNLFKKVARKWIDNGKFTVYRR